MAQPPKSPTSQQQQQYPYAHLTAEQQNRIQEDLADRERQASALAAAGMVAESVNLTRPAVIGQVLQAPPPLVGIPLPHGSNHHHHHHIAGGIQNSSGSGEVAMEGINWNMVDLGPSVVDDMDMDFAAMFDPEQEQAFMETTNSSSSTTGHHHHHHAPAPWPPALAPAPGVVATEEHGTPNPLNATSV
jgi:hypothetical protein